MRGISWLAADPVSFSRRTLLHGVSKVIPVAKRVTWAMGYKRLCAKTAELGAQGLFSHRHVVWVCRKMFTATVVVCESKSTKFSPRMGHAVAQLVETMRCKPTGRDHWVNPFWVDLASNRNEHQKYYSVSRSGRCLGLTSLFPSRNGSLEILGASDS